MKKGPSAMIAAAAEPTATGAATGTDAAIVVTAAIAARAAATATAAIAVPAASAAATKRLESKPGRAFFRRRKSCQFLLQGRADDRFKDVRLLRGSSPSAADRPVADHRGQHQEAARAGKAISAPATSACFPTS